MKISVVVHTYNAEKFLRKCLEALVGFDEILICDMHSTDQTIPIANEFGARIIYHENVGYADPARDFAIHSAANEWVLVVDADEIVTPELKKYLYDFLDSPKAEKYAGLFLTCKNFFMGRFLYGSYPNYILRFMRQSKAYWPPTVHSKPKIDGEVMYIPKRDKKLSLIHLGNDNVTEKLRKMNIYSSLEVVRRKGKKISFAGIIFKPYFRFVKEYILKGGFRSGRAGYVFARMSSTYKMLTIAKMWEEEMDKDKE